MDVEKVNMVISEVQPIDIIDRDGQWYLIGADGQPVSGAEEPHVSREEAEAHLQAMVQSDKPLPAAEEPVIKFDDSAPGQPKEIFIPLQKVDSRKHQVWGYAAVEEPDHADEIMDYESSKPYWMEWSTRAQKRSGGRSMGNLRSMHKRVAAGRLIEFLPDDQNRGFYIGAEVVDEEEWRKVEAGVYTGFSVGGSYVRRWNDYRLNKMRYTARPAEVSLVDAPCIESATFDVVKADGMTETRSFTPGDGTNVLKADIPEAPEAVSSEEAPDGGYMDRMPDPEKPMQISPSSVPNGDTLAARHVGVKDLETAAGSLDTTEGTQEPVTKADEPQPPGDPELMDFTVTGRATPEVAGRFQRFVAMLTNAAGVGHSAMFAMFLDGDGSDRFEAAVAGVAETDVRDIPVDVRDGFEVVKGDFPQPDKKLVKVKPVEKRMVKVRQPRMVKVV